MGLLLAEGIHADFDAYRFSIYPRVGYGEQVKWSIILTSLFLTFRRMIGLYKYSMTHLESCDSIMVGLLPRTVSMVSIPRIGHGENYFCGTTNNAC